MSPRPEILLEAARSIADMLCETAFWSRDGRACNWVAAAAGPDQHHRLQALGPALYGGLSGVALFLAGAYAAFGTPKYHAACRGALAAATAERDGGRWTNSDLSLFEGRLGLYFAAGQIASIAGIESAVALADVTRLVGDAAQRPHALDVMSGNAGAICALANFQPIDLRPRLSALALQLGDEILRNGQPNGTALAWAPLLASGFPIAQVPLCGLSHGASGMAVAALRLFAAGARPEFLSAARAAFEYEDRMFDPAAGSWPDVRAGGPTTGGAATFDAWCHGAGGIAVARMSACQCDRELGGQHRGVALHALERTAAVLTSQLDDDGADDCLCHGTAGLAEICMAGGEFFGIARYRAIALRAADQIATRYLDLGAVAGWPDDVVNRPGFMLGTSGVGYALLRLGGCDQLAPATNLFGATGRAEVSPFS